MSRQRQNEPQVKPSGVGVIGAGLAVLLLISTLVACGTPGEPLDASIVPGRTSIPSATPLPYEWDCNLRLALDTNDNEIIAVGDEFRATLQTEDCEFEPAQIEDVHWDLDPTEPLQPGQTTVALVAGRSGYRLLRVTWSGRARPIGGSDTDWIDVERFAAHTSILVRTRGDVAVAPATNGGFVAAAVTAYWRVGGQASGGLFTADPVAAADGTDLVWTSHDSLYSGANIVQSAGVSWVAAVTSSGQLRTKRTNTDGWSPSVTHGLRTWDASEPPQIVALADGGVLLAAKKRDGQLYTRTADKHGTWGAWQHHGRPNWGQVAAHGSADGSVWLLATKDDGRLYTRVRNAEGEWGSFTLHGHPSWDPRGGLAVVGLPSGAALIAAMKEDGRLYTRSVDSDGTGSAWTLHARAGWSEVDLAFDSLGTVTMVGLKEDRRIYTRSWDLQATAWESWVRHTAPFPNEGRPVEKSEPVAIAADANGDLLVMTTKPNSYGSSFANANDANYFRLRIDGTWGPWTELNVQIAGS